MMLKIAMGFVHMLIIMKTLVLTLNYSNNAFIQQVRDLVFRLQNHGENVHTMYMYIHSRFAVKLISNKVGVLVIVKLKIYMLYTCK